VYEGWEAVSVQVLHALADVKCILLLQALLENQYATKRRTRRRKRRTRRRRRKNLKTPKIQLMKAYRHIFRACVQHITQRAQWRKLED
jgi:hypothetical protein